MLNQFPWYAVNDYTLGQRNHIYSATCDLLRHLAASIKRGDVPNLNEGILFELMNAGLNAPGFSEKQRWQLIQAAGFTGNEIRISPLAKWWPWEALGRKVKAEEDVIEVRGSLSFALTHDAVPATIFSTITVKSIKSYSLFLDR